MIDSAIAEVRVRAMNDARPNPNGDYVLYWMCASRRPTWNFGLQRAVEWSLKLGRPLVILEALGAGYPWASPRMHHWTLDGMRDNQRFFSSRQLTYYPYVETVAGQGRGLIRALGKSACVVVTDDYPCFSIPKMIAAAAKQLAIRIEAVDSNGLLPIRIASESYKTAHAFRRVLHRALPRWLSDFPLPDPTAATLPAPIPLPDEIIAGWPNAVAQLEDIPALVAACVLDHSVEPAPETGGFRAADSRWRDFFDNRLTGYGQNRNHPDRQATSGLSPYLHFGQIASHQIVAELLEARGWGPELLCLEANGRRQGFWGLNDTDEAFLDQLVTWRELGFNFCAIQPDDYRSYESLPAWARTTLEDHADDPRQHLYDLDQFEQSATHDPLWNAAQRELTRTGRMHNYLRMLWGKKILEWSPSARSALETMITLNDKYALDGRDPNSYSGIFWVLGRYDRAWGPERLIFGKVRYMSSANTRRKLKLKSYLERNGSKPTERNSTL